MRSEIYAVGMTSDSLRWLSTDHRQGGRAWHKSSHGHNPKHGPAIPPTSSLTVYAWLQRRATGTNARTGAAASRTSRSIKAHWVMSAGLGDLKFGGVGPGYALLGCADSEDMPPKLICLTILYSVYAETKRCFHEGGDTLFY